ncbi:MAG TPA: M10 family metallopeptidase C-terminal domain-containing protein [Arsenophonus sp.]
MHTSTNGQHFLIFVHEFQGKPGKIKVTYDAANKLSKFLINKDYDIIANFAIDIHGYIDPQTDFIFV